MFEVTGRTIRLSRGDTGVIAFEVEGAALTDEDRAVFTVRRSGGRMMQKVIPPVDGRFYVPFANGETDGWRPGLYEWDLRVVLGAQLAADGSLQDGREVITPWAPSRLEVVKVVGDV